MMSDDEETLCAAAVAAAYVVSTAEEQRLAAECKRRTQRVRSLLRSRQQFGTYMIAPF